MTMSSIVKFRIINLVGASLFCTYGFLIGALPVALLNGFIVTVDIYYLYGIFSKREQFEILEVRPDNRYLLRFLKFHNKQIQQFFPGFSYVPDADTLSFFVLRDMAVAGVFLARKAWQGQKDTLLVNLDYVIPEYRDFKNGKFVYYRLKHEFLKAGFKRILSKTGSKPHSKYLLKMGFADVGDGLYEIRMD